MKLSSFIDYIFPPVCLVCKSFYHPQRQEIISWKNIQFDLAPDFARVMIPYLCLKCSAKFSNISSPVCVRCGFIFNGDNFGAKICNHCFNYKGYFRKARTFGLYDRALKDAVHLLKYWGKIQLAKPLGMLLFSAFIKHWKDSKPDIIIPVPLHKTRFRERGFNQSYLLFKDWPGYTKNMPVHISSMRINRKILVRNRKTLSQVGMNKDQRYENIKGAFTVTAPGKIRGKSILLIDDVYTTGSTAEECAKTLMECGAKYVDVLTLARTLMN